jgi:hypothetical protein
VTAPRRRRRAWTRPRELGVTLPDVVIAPELAVLALLDQAVRISADALLVAQPALIGDPPPWRLSPELVAARRLLDCAMRLANATANYRRCVLPAAYAGPHDDDDERVF